MLFEVVEMGRDKSNCRLGNGLTLVLDRLASVARFDCERGTLSLLCPFTRNGICYAVTERPHYMSSYGYYAQRGSRFGD